MREYDHFPDIPKEKFRFAGHRENENRWEPDIKGESYFRDALRRFRKNKSSVAAAWIILALVLYAVLVPVFCQTAYSQALTDTTCMNYAKLLPKNPLFVKLRLPFWDGGRRVKLSEAGYLSAKAITAETGYANMIQEYGVSADESGRKRYDCRVDSYVNNGFTFLTLSENQYRDIQNWQNTTGIQVIYPATNDRKSDANIWYETTPKGTARLDKNGNFIPNYKTTGSDGGYASLRVPGDDGSYRYAVLAGNASTPSYKCRVFRYAYFQYRYGFEPSFLFGTNGTGQDIFTRLAAGARFSLLFAICVSAVNMVIGGIYGAVEGYYGGGVDLLMERISDILYRIPFMVVATLFQLHLAKRVGAAVSLLFAFVLTGWIGMASTVRMQFYRFKGQEYVLAARTLGAGDGRLMFRHIFPNALGTIITSGVLMIPGVLFTESTLTYLGIVDLNSAALTSVGTMLAGGRQYLGSFPHIIFFPALFISLLEISFNLFGNGLRDALNPALRGSEV